MYHNVPCQRKHKIVIAFLLHFIAPSATGLDIIGLVQIAVPITGSILIVLLFLSTVFFIMKVIRRRYDIRYVLNTSNKHAGNQMDNFNY